MRPHRRQPTRVSCPWDSPGKNTGVDCHFLLQCMKVKSESEVIQSCPTLCDPIDGSPPGSSIHGIFQARVLEWGAIAFSSSFASVLFYILVIGSHLSFLGFSVNCKTNWLELTYKIPFLWQNQSINTFLYFNLIFFLGLNLTIKWLVYLPIWKFSYRVIDFLRVLWELF